MAQPDHCPREVSPLHRTEPSLDPWWLSAGATGSSSGEHQTLCLATDCAHWRWLGWGRIVQELQLSSLTVSVVSIASVASVLVVSAFAIRSIVTTTTVFAGVCHPNMAPRIAWITLQIYGYTFHSISRSYLLRHDTIQLVVSVEGLSRLFAVAKFYCTLDFAFHCHFNSTLPIFIIYGLIFKSLLCAKAHWTGLTRVLEDLIYMSTYFRYHAKVDCQLIVIRRNHVWVTCIV